MQYQFVFCHTPSGAKVALTTKVTSLPASIAALEGSKPSDDWEIESFRQIENRAAA